MDANPLIEFVAHRRAADRLVLIGIGGRGCAGKSTLAHLIPSAQIIATDEFWDGTDFRLDRVLTDVLTPLAAGRSASFESWDWAARAPVGQRTVAAKGVVVIEGVCALHRTLRSYYDLRVWVETPPDLRLARAVQRDGESSRSTWLEQWFPREARYLATDDPVACAELIVAGDD